MCYRPLHLINNTRHFDVNSSKVFRSVPCGHCGECNTKLQNSFEARVYYEYLDTVQKGGYVFFQTFTYNEECCPWSHGIRVFSRRDIRLFTKNLNNEWTKRFGSRDGLKYFITCEYGGTTYRPHYHALFFITQPISVEEFAKITEDRWSRYDLKGNALSIGFCDTNNPDPKKRHAPSQRVVNAQGALSYVSKYVCKDFDFDKMLAGQAEMTDCHLDCDVSALKPDEKKEIFPFHRQSNGLGLCMKDMIPYEDLVDGKVKIPDSVKVEKYVSLPQYIDRKVFYDYNPDDKCFKLNEAGVEMKKVRDAHNREYVKKSILFILNNMEQMYSLASSAIDKKLPCFSDWADARLAMHDLLAGRSLDNLVTYIQYYKDLVIPHDIELVDDLESYGQYLYMKDINSDVDYRLVPDVDSVSDGYLLHRNKMLNKLRDRGIFEGFEEIISILNIYNMCYCQVLQNKYIQSKLDKSRRKYIHSLYR